MMRRFEQSCVRTVVRLGLSSGVLKRSRIANATDATAVLGTLMI